MLKIVLFPKIQVDTAITYFLLKQFGESKFPGISKAELLFWTQIPEDKSSDALEAEGYILIDLGGGKFDHHRLGPDNKKISASHLMAEHLEVEDLPEIQKLLEFARRDDLLGKGTISKDPLDRCFGFPGLLMSLVKTYPKNPEYILASVQPMIEAHYFQEYQKYQTLPKEYQEMLKEGLATEFNAIQIGKQLKVVLLNSDNLALTGYVRSRAVNANLVIQRASTGHVNFVSNQKSNLRLHELAKRIKLLEAEKNDLVLPLDSMNELMLPGKTKSLPHWYYDTRANTLQNGGMNPGTVPATKLLDNELEIATKKGLNIPKDSYPPSFQKRPQHKKPFNRNNNKSSRFGNSSGYKTTYTRGAIIID